ncbi:MAG TPA: VWA domain-containing protein [Acidimicrobiia bacterium]|jgi:Ca-activated chloride channel family protein
MDFAAPHRLWLLVLAAGCVVAYVAVQRRRRRAATRFASPALLPLLVPRRPGWWRHLIAAGFAAGLVLATVGAAQPTIPGEAERKQATIIVAIDASDSMGATDVKPDRITAAISAARSFIGDLPSTFHVGLVTANAAPAVIVAPTTDHQAVQNALDTLKLSPGTALGEAIFTSLAALPRQSGASAAPAGTETDGNKAPSAHVVLLSDGVTTTGRPDSEAIDAAVAAGVPVSTIAFGTDNASVVSQGQTVEVPVDDTALRSIAEGTGGTFFDAASTAELRQVYEQIDADVTVVPTDRDIAEWFAGGALIVLVVAAVISMLTTARVVWT